MKITHLSNKKRNKQQTPYYTNILSSDDNDDYFQPDIFAPYTQEYCTQKPRQTQTSQNVKIYQQNAADIQSHQPLLLQNPINTQSYQPVQSQNPISVRFDQPTQTENEIPPPYYLQQHEIIKNSLTNFSQIPNAAESSKYFTKPSKLSRSSISLTG